MINFLTTTQPDFQQKLAKLQAKDRITDPAIITTVEHIINKVKSNGDKALIDYCNQFDGTKASTIADLNLNQNNLKTAFAKLNHTDKTALQTAAERIRDYHTRQKQNSWTYTDADGTLLGQKSMPIERVGIYVPGAKAAYPSSVLMSAIPAKVAGVSELVMMVPTANGAINPLVLAAAHIAQVDKVWTVGGAQAIAALAYGTESIAKVDKIVGPGNIYVATAKRLVFGQVGIDMLAGPSEILIICDGKINPDWIAMDLFSQAEHEQNAQAILLCPDADFINKVKKSITSLLPTMPRQAIIKTALKNRGALIQTKNLKESADIANQIAPEHLQLALENPKTLLPSIKHAGAIFMGYNTCEALGDYCAGPSHILPTSGTARFSSVLDVADFQKKTSLIMASAKGADKLGKIAATLADSEGFQAHAQSARYRMQS